MISLYIHIPFCKSKCKYCAFYSHTGDTENYISALLRSFEYWSERADKKLSTVYIGGGTPSVLTAPQLERLLLGLHKYFDVSELAEFTIECNPESVTDSFLCTAKAFGADRISLGIQSFNDKELSAVGRLHTAKDALCAVDKIRKNGFDNISCDLIFGLPYQTVQSLENSLESLSALDVPHISCYNLQVECGTPLYDLSLPVPGEDIQAEMYELVCSHLEDKGYRHYEISNYAKRGFEAVHNSKYWDGSDYLGLGPSAHSKLGNLRAGFDADTGKFISRSEFDFDFCEEITDADFERIMLGLRTDTGVPLHALSHSTAYVNMLCKNGFAKTENGNLILTDKGFYLSNTIISEITAKEC